jgi:hypothetical protein
MKNKIVFKLSYQLILYVRSYVFIKNISRDLSMTRTVGSYELAKFENQLATREENHASILYLKG